MLFKIVSGLLVAGFLTEFLLLLWRDVCAPSTLRPGYECMSRGRGSAVYFVPCWFNLFLHAAMGITVVAFLLLPAIYGAYPHLHPPSRDENPSGQR